MLKNIIKRTIKFAAKELAEAIVEEQVRQGLYMQNSRQWFDYPYFVPQQMNEQDIIKPFGFEITWCDTQAASNLHSVNFDAN